MTALLDAPIVLLCSERSGSNLIAKIFDPHPAVAAPGAAHLFRITAECASRYRPGSDELRQAVLALFDVKVSSWAIDSLTEADRAACLADCTTAPEMAAALYAAEARAADKRHVLTKENSAFAYLPAILGQATRPRLLFMVRDPRDMAVSWTNGPVMRGGVVRAAERWVHDQAGSLDSLAARPAGITRRRPALRGPAGRPRGGTAPRLRRFRARLLPRHAALLRAQPLGAG